MDWGHEVWPPDGTKIYCFAFILSHARLRYVEYPTALDTGTFLNSLARAFAYIGGVPQQILFDNAKVVVSERVGRVVRFHPDLLAFALAYGFQPEACWVEDPETKGKVESTGGYVHRDFYEGTFFPDHETLGQPARAWCDRVNGEVHATTHAIPREQWAVERPHLRPLPPHRPTLFRVQSVRVTKTSTFTFRQNQYSVPKDYARRTVRLEIFEHEFRALAGEPEWGRWSRTTAKGQRFFEPSHYAGRFPGTKRSALEHQFRTLCEAAPAYLDGLVYFVKPFWLRRRFGDRTAGLVGSLRWPVAISTGLSTPCHPEPIYPTPRVGTVRPGRGESAPARDQTSPGHT